MARFATGLALAFAFAASSQAATLIDDFTTPQSVVAGTGTGLASGGVATGSSSLGGTRAVTLVRDEFAAGTDAVQISPSTGAVFTTDCCSGASWTLLYDGGLDSSIDFTGLGGVAVSPGGLVIRMQTHFFVDIRVLVTTSSTAQSFRDAFGYPTDDFIDVSMPFDTFLLAPGATAPADLAKVGALVVSFHFFPEDANQAASFRLASIQALPEPLPGSAAGLGLVLALLSRWRRARRPPPAPAC